MDDRHPVVTLVGRGGIGKTWLALTVLHEIALQGKYVAIVWLSARDIDLLPQGAKIVTPHVLTQNDMAKEFVRLLNPAESLEKSFKPLNYFAQSLTSGTVGPILFVFDNFETVRSPVELYTWLDTYIRLPNKILITSRSREFRGDYPIEVGGMTEQESEALINSTAGELGIRSWLTEEYKRQLYHESEGHPYVIKILLGEVAKAGKLMDVERIVASKDEILFALFERTYSRLSAVAKRVFLTLSNWRSTIPQLAIEAVLLRPSNERMDVAQAIDQLSLSSLIEISTSTEDNETFITVPLAAALFGKRKLAASPMKSAVEADTQLLHAFGASQRSDIRYGATPRIEKLFRYVADRVSHNRDELQENLPMLEFIARRYPKAWLLLASLHEEFEPGDGMENVKRACRRFLESEPDVSEKLRAWRKLSEICQRTSDWSGEVHALVEMCELPSSSFNTISYTADRLNTLFARQYLVLDTDEKQVLLRRLAEVMETRIDEGDADDYGNLAWLYLHLGGQGAREHARKFTDIGLAKEPLNGHLLKLSQRL